MAFCSKCGKEIADGQVCSCQKTKSSANIDVANEATNLVTNVIDVASDPEGGVSRFLNSASWAKIAILTAIYAVLDVIYGIFSKVKSNIRHKKDLEEYADNLDMDLDEYLDFLDIDSEKLYEIGDIVKGVFNDIISVAVAVAIAALVFWLAFKFISKAEISWKKAFAIATIDLLIAIPVFVVYHVLDFIPDFKLLSWILSSISAFGVWGEKIIAYLAIRSESDDTKSAIYVAAPSILATTFLTIFANFLINSLF